MDAHVRIGPAITSLLLQDFRMKSLNQQQSWLRFQLPFLTEGSLYAALYLLAMSLIRCVPVGIFY